MDEPILENPYRNRILYLYKMENLLNEWRSSFPLRIPYESDTGYSPFEIEIIKLSDSIEEMCAAISRFKEIIIEKRNELQSKPWEEAFISKFNVGDEALFAGKKVKIKKVCTEDDGSFYYFLDKSVNGHSAVGEYELKKIGKGEISQEGE